MHCLMSRHINSTGIIHRNVAAHIWRSYLTSFDRWMVYATARFGTSKKLLKHLMKHMLCHAFSRQIAAAGYLGALKHWHALFNSYDCTLAPNIDNVAAFHGRDEIIMYLAAPGYRSNRHTLSAAMHGGQLETFKWLYGQCSGRMPRRCISNLPGCVEILMFAHSK
jgi:hypothetical protein